jgi:hypothetical protein
MKFSAWNQQLLNKQAYISPINKLIPSEGQSGCHDSNHGASDSPAVVQRSLNRILVNLIRFQQEAMIIVKFDEPTILHAK